MFVKAKDGIKVRDPKTGGHIPEIGAEVPDTNYWQRRIEAGDVVIIEKSATRKSSAATPAEPEAAPAPAENKSPKKLGASKKE